MIHEYIYDFSLKDCDSFLECFAEFKLEYEINAMESNHCVKSFYGSFVEYLRDLQDSRRNMYRSEARAAHGRLRIIPTIPKNERILIYLYLIEYRKKYYQYEKQLGYRWKEIKTLPMKYLAYKFTSMVCNNLLYVPSLKVKKGESLVEWERNYNFIMKK